MSDSSSRSGSRAAPPEPNLGAGRRASQRPVRARRDEGRTLSRHTTIRVLLAAALLVLAPSARANGRFPATNSIVVAPRDPSFLVLRATYGVLVSQDAGKNWDWVCEQSVGFGGVEDPPFALTEKPALVGALFGGMTASQDRGCSFAMLGGDVDKRVMTDLVVAKSRPREVLAVSSSYASRTDAGEYRYGSAVYRSSDEAVSFHKVGPDVDPTVLVETIELAESDPNRIYLSGARARATGDPEGVILASRDGGKSYVAHTLALLPKERAPYIGAVDPRNPDRLYVRTGGDPDLASGRLLVSDDGGTTFRVAWTSTGPLTGLALSPDGTKVYVGSGKDGLLVADAKTLAFEKRAQIYVQCIAVTDTRVYLCSNELYGFVAGESADDGKTFTPMLRLAGLRGPLACPPGSTTNEQCVKDWPRLQKELGPGAVPPDAGKGPAAPAAAAEGCAAVPGGGRVGVVAALVFAAALFAWGRRRRGG